MNTVNFNGYGVLSEDRKSSDIYDSSNIFSFIEKFKYSFLEDYFISDTKKVHEFFDYNENLIDLFLKINSIIKNYFMDGVYVLRVIDNPEYDESKLNLIIQLDYSKYSPKEIVAKLMKFNYAIRPLKRELNLNDKFFADVESL